MEQTRLIKFLATWVINSILLVLISQIFSASVVIGNAALSKGIATVLSAFLLTIVFFLVPVAIEKTEMKVKDDKLWIVLYFVALVIGVWVVKRLSVLTAFGVSSIIFVLLIAVFVAGFDFGVDKYLDILLKRNK